MKMRKTVMMTSLLAAMLAFTACDDGENNGGGEAKCTADVCRDINTLIVCDTATGQTTEKSCSCDMSTNACKDAPVDKCTADKCLDAETLLVCDVATGTTSPKKCACDLSTNACKDAPVDKCTADKCLDAETLSVCDKDSGTTSTKKCACDSSTNACKDAPVEKCTADKCLDAETLSVCDVETGTTSTKKCDCDLSTNACKDAPADKCTADKCLDAETLSVCDKDSGTTSTKKCACDLSTNACKDAPVDKCTADKCLDAETLSVCDVETGTTSTKKCDCDLSTNACKDAPGDKCTANQCKDAGTLIVCDKDSGATAEKSCDCDMNTNACKVEKCTKDICADAKHLMKCSNGVAEKQPCADDELCTFGQCEKKSLSDYDTCKKEIDPVCIGDTMYMMCESIMGDGNYSPIIHQCTAGTICKDGACVLQSSNQCAVTACKDLDNIAECIDGVELVKPCGEGKICMQDACVDAHGVKSCQEDKDCATGQKCYANVCYTKSNFDLKVGDKCNSSTFEEYCKGDVEIKCGYDGTVEENDCSDYNGCGLMFQKAYKLGTPIRNATCRGDSVSLAECDHAGTTNHYCQVYNDPEYPALSFSYSFQSKCVVGTDGKMIFSGWSVETRCSETRADKCDVWTGLCIK